MLASVTPTRTLGRKVPAADRQRQVGGLVTHQVTAGVRSTVALQLLGSDGRPLLPDLCEPRLTSFSGRRLVFSGMECVDKAWVAQEWLCELLSEEDVAGFE